MKLLIVSLIALFLVLVGCKNDPTGAVVGIELEEEPACKDSDGGIDKTIKGIVTIGDDDYADSCVAGLLIEYYCSGDKVVNQNMRCADKCRNGKCT